MALLRSDLLPATGIGYFFKVNLLRYDEKKFIYGKHSCAATPRSIFKVNSLLIRREEGTFSWVRTAGRSANVLQPGILISRRCRTAKLLTPPTYSKYFFVAILYTICISATLPIPSLQLLPCPLRFLLSFPSPILHSRLYIYLPYPPFFPFHHLPVKKSFLHSIAHATA